MSLCFVIQPFDNDEYDARYEDVFVPAIKEAKLTPYRVDRDRSVNNLLEAIENKIKSSVICLADITEPNPNVWYELGYATAIGKNVVLVCAEGTKFPFDVQHRPIIKYKKSSVSYLHALQNEITEKLKALLTAETNMKVLSESLIKETEGLSLHEVIALASIMQNTNAPNGVYQDTIFEDMDRAGSTKLASKIALKTLEKKGMIQVIENADFNDHVYFTYALLDKGENWLIDNQDKLKLSNIIPEPGAEIPF